jgi:hypothetical protein
MPAQHAGLGNGPQAPVKGSYGEASRVQNHQAMGHWRAINPGVEGAMTVTNGTSDVQVSVVRSPDRSDSQADGTVLYCLWRGLRLKDGPEVQEQPLSVFG